MIKWNEEETTYLTAVMHEEDFVRKFQKKYPDRSESSIRNKLRRMKADSESEENFREKMKKYMLEKPLVIQKFLLDKGKFSKIPASQLQNKDYIHEEYSLDNYIAYDA